MSFVDFVLGDPIDHVTNAYTNVLVNTIEENLPHILRETKELALSGDAEAQYKMGRYYREIWEKFVLIDKDTKAFYAAHYKASRYFLLEAEEKGCNEALMYIAQL
jgi:hypothetical protein